MDIKSGYPWWTVSNGLLGAFPSLQGDARSEVVVIGAGITGALIAAELQRAGLEVMLLDGREAGWGSTSASTALLQYEIDTPMAELARRYGQDAARLAYLACDEALDSFAAVVGELDQDVGHRANGSLYFASKRRHVRAMREEFVLRRAAGLPVELLERDAVRERFALEAPLALWTPHAARVDPYRCARHLLAQLERRGARVHDRGAVTEWHSDGTALKLRLEHGQTVHCQHLVIAAGYESQRWLKQRWAVNHSSYAMVTEPLEQLPLGLQDHLLWESARPYVYLRGTDDGRVLIGGEDDKLDLPAKRDAVLPRKLDKLLARLRQLAPDQPFTPSFGWAGTFAETEDGLPYIGTPPEHDSRVHFALAYGGNGITYSTIAAAMIREAIFGRRHPLDALFGFGRH